MTGPPSAALWTHGLLAVVSRDSSPRRDPLALRGPSACPHSPARGPKVPWPGAPSPHLGSHFFLLVVNCRLLLNKPEIFWPFSCTSLSSMVLGFSGLEASPSHVGPSQKHCSPGSLSPLTSPACLSASASPSFPSRPNFPFLAPFPSYLMPPL